MDSTRITQIVTNLSAVRKEVPGDTQCIGHFQQVLVYQFLCVMIFSSLKSNLHYLIAIDGYLLCEYLLLHYIVADPCLYINLTSFQTRQTPQILIQ